MVLTRVRRGAAPVLFAAWLAAGGPAVAGERMPAGEIEKTFSGMTLDGIYADGTFFTETYKEDGSIRYHDPDGADSGQWSVDDGRFCTFYEASQGACFFVERDGANCFTFFAGEGSGDALKPAADWTSRGWNRELPPTCPKAPEVQL
ncbi:MAG: hypothetical protein J0H54_10280 [Rhizobiales bacterium]|nr:hypothetical protein [Hyphomicrobiales bacterium]